MNQPIDTSTVDFHFDVMCPYAYQTSKWIRRVRDQIDLTINWRFFSLEEVNLKEGKKHPWEREWSYGWSLMRIGALLRRTSMDDLDRWYEIAARSLHEEGRRPHQPEVARHLLQEIGLDPALVDEALSDPTTHDEIKTEHQRVVDAGGFGVPTLFFGDHCLFGPVLINPPEGEAAVRLWNGCRVGRVPRPLRASAAQDQDAREANHRVVQALSRSSRLGQHQPWCRGRLHRRRIRPRRSSTATWE
ncbi:MAG: DsbA family protein [Acidimicrobiales bacterium]